MLRPANIATRGLLRLNGWLLPRQERFEALFPDSVSDGARFRRSFTQKLHPTTFHYFDGRFEFGEGLGRDALHSRILECPSHDGARRFGCNSAALIFLDYRVTGFDRPLLIGRAFECHESNQLAMLSVKQDDVRDME